MSCPITFVSTARSSPAFFQHFESKSMRFGSWRKSERDVLELGSGLPSASVVGSACPTGACSPSAHSSLPPGTECPSWRCHGKQGFLVGFEAPYI